MLVQSRTKACGTCTARKIKCDKLSPACSQCVRDSWKCPGYAKVWKKRQVKCRRPRYDHEWLPAYKTPQGSSNFQQSESRLRVDPASPAHSTPPTSGNYLLPLSFPSSSPLLLQLIDHLNNERPIGLRIYSMGSFFHFIPPRLGHSRALDHAVRCICSAYSSLLRSNCSIIDQDRREYYRALRSLRLACLDKDQVLSSNVLCATILLSWYEILTNNLDNSCITHVRGCSSLIQLRGPARHQSAFDYALLKAEEGYISSEAILQRKPCFLDSQVWHPILNPQIPSPPQLSAVSTANKSLVLLSVFISALDNLQLLTEAEAERSILALCALHHEIKFRLETALRKEDRDVHTPIICCKESNFLILIDTTLLRILNSRSTPSSLVTTIVFAFSYQPSTQCWLEEQIMESFEIFKQNVELATRATPFNMRKMLYLCRVACQERRRREDCPHPVWTLFENVIHEVNEPGFAC